jgi:hypothetical protein
MSVLGNALSTCGMWAVIFSGSVGLVRGQEATEASAAVAPQTAASQPSAGVQPANERANERANEPTIGSAESQSIVKAGMPRKPAAGRLPRYFASLVDSRQREAIYQIQASMAAKVEALEMQLEELRQAEMREIEAVLNDTQLRQLQSLRASRLTGAPAAGT